MPRESLLSLLRRWTLPVVLGLAMAMNVCGAPLDGHAHALAAEDVSGIPADDHHDGPSVSCDAHAFQLPTQPDTLFGPTLGAVIDAVVPIRPTGGPAPLAPATTYRPPLFLLHASLQI